MNLVFPFIQNNKYKIIFVYATKLSRLIKSSNPLAFVLNGHTTQNMTSIQIQICLQLEARRLYTVYKSTSILPLFADGAIGKVVNNKCVPEM